LERSPRSRTKFGTRAENRNYYLLSRRKNQKRKKGDERREKMEIFPRGTGEFKGG